jgi:hypothetical protein
MERGTHPWLAGLLLAWIAGIGLLNASWRNPDPPDLIATFEAIAPELPEGEIGFLSSRERRAEGYAWSAFRFAISPRRPVRETRHPRSEWLVADRIRRIRGYAFERRLAEGLTLMHREDSRSMPHAGAASPPGGHAASMPRGSSRSIRRDAAPPGPR